MIPPIDVLLEPDTQTSGTENPMLNQSRLDSCAKIKKLGFTASTHIKMYGERFDIVSEPFIEGDCIAVRATSGNDPEIRTVRLPIAILVGLADRFLKKATLAGNRLHSLV